MLEARYRTMESLAEGSGCTLVDLPCGYTPRSIAFARKGLPYYGLDLPVVIREISGWVNEMEPLNYVTLAGERLGADGSFTCGERHNAAGSIARRSELEQKKKASLDKGHHHQEHADDAYLPRFYHLQGRHDK